MIRPYDNRPLPPGAGCIFGCLALQARLNPGAVAIDALDRKPPTCGRLQLFLEQSTEWLNSLRIGRQDGDKALKLGLMGRWCRLQRGLLQLSTSARLGPLS